LADDAHNYGSEIFEDLEFVRLQIVGLAIAGSYHLWERVTKEFLLRELVRQIEDAVRLKSQIHKACFEKIVGLLEQMGWQVRMEPFYPELDRLRLIANAVKHGDGPSTTKLLEAAPELFLDFGGDFLNKNLGAEELRLTRQHFEVANAAVASFFETFPEELVKEGSLSV
jgi:hypothetical protein